MLEAYNPGIQAGDMKTGPTSPGITGLWLVSLLLCLIKPAAGKYKNVDDNKVLPECIWRSSFSPTLPTVQKAVPPFSCSKGEVWWFYPRGIFRFQTRRESIGVNSNFNLCISSMTVATVKGMYNETISSLPSTRMPMPSLGRDSCIPSRGGWVKLFLVAPDVMTNVIKLRYRLDPT